MKIQVDGNTSKTTKRLNDLKIIGADEWCAFKRLGIPAIRARVDSGAKTSSIHATNIEIFDKNGVEWVRFEVDPIQDNPDIIVKCEAKLLRSKKVKSSMGTSEERLMIRTPLTLGKNTFSVKLTLASRDTMNYRMLLGREALNGRYLIDPSQHCLLGEFSEETILEKYTKEKR
ncbi:RimK/LysX family protein [Pricia sp. S334]|uniref:RimK/LysX family protein n=1 Tax=Pricia mediterranea TaxID=3076079 RepID=A0ABU3L4G2_9FLAO|nr:RimK/LysX family protein [Pricia sp. S334]MDT7828625.1 RimK/LysX family protein [Pricia sp. S334]